MQRRPSFKRLILSNLRSSGKPVSFCTNHLNLASLHSLVQKRLSFSTLTSLPALTLPILLLIHLMASTHHTLRHFQRTFYAMTSLSMSPWIHSMSPNPLVQTVFLHTLYMLKYTAASTAPSITELFNSSLTLTSVPQQRKEARTIPIPKVLVPKSPNNYRPTSLLSLLSKILDKHLYYLIDHLEEGHLLSDSQWDSDLATQLPQLFCPHFPPGFLA